MTIYMLFSRRCRFIYLMPWNLVCGPWVSWSFYKTTNIRQLTEWNESKMFTCDFKCVCVCVCVCVRVRAFVWGIVAYYCVCMCEWYIVYVYVKVIATRVVFTVVFFVLLIIIYLLLLLLLLLLYIYYYYIVDLS